MNNLTEPKKPSSPKIGFSSVCFLPEFLSENGIKNVCEIDALAFEERRRREAAPELLHGTEELYARLYVLRARRRRCLPFFRFRVNRVKTAVFHRVT